MSPVLERVGRTCGGGDERQGKGGSVGHDCLA